MVAIALSPDGRWLAAGGWAAEFEKTGVNVLSLVDLRTGAICSFGSFKNTIDEVSFSQMGGGLLLAWDTQACEFSTA